MGLTEWGMTEWGLLTFNLVALFVIIRFLKGRLTTKLTEIEERQSKSTERHRDERKDRFSE